MKRKTKYGAEKIIIDGIIFASKKEGRYYLQLLAQKKAVLLKDRVISFDRQVSFKYNITAESNGNIYTYSERYVCDFIVKYGDGRSVVVDVKGYRTDVYKRKKKIVESLFNIDIIEV